MVNRSRSLFVGCLVSGLLAMNFACGGGGSHGGGTVTPPPPPSGSGVEVGQVALEVKGSDAKGVEHLLSSHRGKVVLMVFTTMWCPPCRAEAGVAERLFKKYESKGFVIFECVYQNESGGPPSPSDLQRWASTYGLTFPVLNPGSAAVATFGIRSIPTNLVIGRDGVIAYKAAGYDEAAIEAEIVKQLAR